ncbi:MAG: glycosyltransferase [Planctomycetota bacterium]|nr:glycosyltransferase [Planctomycetota bacterium]
MESSCQDAPDAAARRVADVLVVTLCSGVSLGVLRSCGILEREWSLYERLSAHYGRIVLVTEGGEGERAIAAGLPSRCPVGVIENTHNLERPAFTVEAAQRACALVADGPGKATSAVVRIDQMWGGDLAVTVCRALRERGVRTGLIARGGYPWSRFVAWEAGADSQRAAEAAAEEGDLCRAADVVVGTTETMLDDLRWRYGLAPERTRLVPNFVPDAARPDDTIKREAGRVLFAGRLVGQKRVDLLIDAVALVPSLARGARQDLDPSLARGALRKLPHGVPALTIVGGGELERGLRARAKDRGIEVEFLPRLPHGELLGRMQRCAVYAQTSAYEGHPKTVLEAMACGTPVVVTNGPGLGDVVDNGVTGIVTASTPEAVAAGLVRMLRAGDEAAAMGQAAAESASEFRFDTVVEREIAAHGLAIERAGKGTAPSPGVVRWGPELLETDAETAAAAWARSLHGYARRLPDTERARFCATVEKPVYDVIDRAAIETAGGVHPKHHLMRYHDFFVDRIRPGERVLDLGCGYGAVARSIVEHAGAHVTGMDFSAENVGLAQAMVKREGLGDRLRIVSGDITQDRAFGAHGEEHFDVVVLSNVLEHLADRERLLALYATWYTPRTILIRVPAFDRDWVTAWKEELGVDSRSDPTHETEYTEESLRNELKAAGLGAAEMIVRWGEYWVQTSVPGAFETKPAHVADSWVPVGATR